MDFTIFGLSMQVSWVGDGSAGNSSDSVDV